MSAITLIFRFRPSRSPAYHEALTLAQRGRLTTVQQGKTTWYESSFALPSSPDVVDTMLRLTDLMKGVRGCGWYLNGRLSKRAWRVLRCYRESLAVTDLRAHCWSKVNLIQRLPHVRVGRSGTIPIRTSFVESTYFPCRLATYIYADFDIGHPASLRAQAEATLVREGCEWCPSLRLDEWELRYGNPKPVISDQDVD